MVKVVSYQVLILGCLHCFCYLIPLQAESLIVNDGWEDHIFTKQRNSSVFHYDSTLSGSHAADEPLDEKDAGGVLSDMASMDSSLTDFEGGDH